MEKETEEKRMIENLIIIALEIIIAVQCYRLGRQNGYFDGRYKAIEEFTKGCFIIANDNEYNLLKEYREKRARDRGNER